MRYLLACLAFVACDSSNEGPRDIVTDTADTGESLDTAPDLAPDSGQALPDTGEALADTGEALADTGEALADTGGALDDTGEALTDSSQDVPDTASDADITPPAAPSIYLTIAAVPPEMNGSRPAFIPAGDLPFRLRANRERVDLDVIALADSGPFALADLALECTANGQPHALPAATEAAAGHLHVAIDAAHAFPDGADILCTATISTAAGTTTSTYTFDAATLPPKLDPFPSTDIWLVLTRRDTWALEVTPLPDGTTQLLSKYTPQGDGIDDFDAPFYEVGLMPTSDPAAAALIRAHLIERVRAIVNGIYGLDGAGRPTPGGVDLRLYFEGDAGAPSPADFGDPSQRFSMIALTGDGAPDDQLGGTFGRALIDWNNQDVEDDTVYGLGIWPAAIVRTILKNPAGALLLGECRPSLGGIPFGAAVGDSYFIGRDVDPNTVPNDYAGRATRYNLLMQFGSLAIAAILSHEVGHSLGLVPFGPPPEGLFAGVQTDWVVSLAPDAHIDIAGLNVMQTGASVNWAEAISGALPVFEPLSWAYLTRQLVVGPPGR